MGKTADEQKTLPRKLSGLGLWLLMINGMIGAGIFGIPASAAALAGHLSPLLYLLCALLITPVMLCFAELGSATRETGGPARYLAVAFGPMAGFQAGWALYIARMTAFAANLNLLLGALAHFWPELAGGPPRIIGLAMLSALLAWLNIVGVRRALQSLGGLTILKLGPLLLLVLAGLSWLPGASPQPAWPPPIDADVGSAVLLVIYAFVGFESGLIPGGEARHPERDVPRALLASLALCALLYALLQWICLAALPDLTQSRQPLVELGKLLLGPWGSALLLLTVITSVGGNLLASMFSAPRLTYALAEQRLLPPVFAQLHPEHRTPQASILCYALLAWLLAGSGSFIWLAGLSVVVRVLIYLASIAAMPRVRRQAGIGALRLPLGWLIPVAAVAVCLFLLAQVTWQGALATAALLAVGSGLYLLARGGAGRWNGL